MPPDHRVIDLLPLDTISGIFYGHFSSALVLQVDNTLTSAVPQQSDLSSS